MIPRLLPADTTNFNTAGISLTDTISCTVTEERNGVFTLEMVVATTTPYFDQIKEGMLIVVKPNHTQTLQAFEICKISRPILQRVTILANHISYKQSFIPVEPFSCTGITATLQGLVNYSLENNPFTFITDITNETSTYNQIEPASLRSRLGGTEGSVLDVFGGEYLWNNYETQLLLHRGQDNGVELRVAKNITDLEQTTDLDTVVTGALPCWSDEDQTQFFYGDIQYNTDSSKYAYHRTVVLDLSEEFETAPTVNQLNAAAREYIDQVNLGLPSTNIKVSYVDLADTEEYKDSILERTNLCDTVNVIYTPLNISYKAKVIKLVFDVLAERTLSVEVGEARSTISKTITDLVGDVSSVIKTGKKLVSVTQKIDRELGEVRTTVASVQQTVDGSLNHITYLYAYGNSATTKPSDSAFTYSTMPPLVSGKYIWRMSLAYTNENPTSNPTKTYEMIQGATGDDGVSVTQIDNLYYLKDALLDISLNGNTTQGANPSPSSPQAIHSVSGDNEIRVTSKNLLGLTDGTYTNNGITAVVNNGEIKVSGATDSSNVSIIDIPIATLTPSLGTLTKSLNPTGTYTGLQTSIRNATGSAGNLWSNNGSNATQALSITGVLFRIQINTNITINCTILPQIELGSTATIYEPYKAQVYPINLGSIELNALGDYKDYFYKSNGKWYLHKAIDKVDMGTLTWGWGNASWGIFQANLPNGYNTPGTQERRTNILSTIYPSSSGIAINSTMDDKSILTAGTYAYVRDTSYSSWRAFTSSVSGATLYYVRTATNVEVTDETLISQLTALQRAMSYDGGTSILQTNSDNPFAITYEESALTRPAKPTAEVTSMSTLPEVWSLQTADYISGYRFYTCLQIHYDNNTLTWTDVVEDKSLQDVREKIVTMSTDIIQNTEAINLKADSSTVEQGFNDMGDRIAQTEQANADLQVRANSISSSVSETRTLLETNYATKSELTNSVNSLSTTIQQTASDITLTIVDVQETLNDQGSQISTLETYIRGTSRGVEIGDTASEVTAIYGSNEMAFYNKANTKLAWLNTDDGLGASALSIGDATTASNRWRVFTRQNGSHLTFSRHS